jgi:hypothetical protein
VYPPITVRNFTYDLAFDFHSHVSIIGKLVMTFSWLNHRQKVCEVSFCFVMHVLSLNENTPVVM